MTWQVPNNQSGKEAIGIDKSPDTSHIFVPLQPFLRDLLCHWCHCYSYYPLHVHFWSYLYSWLPTTTSASSSHSPPVYSPGLSSLQLSSLSLYSYPTHFLIHRQDINKRDPAMSSPVTRMPEKHDKPRLNPSHLTTIQSENNHNLYLWLQVRALQDLLPGSVEEHNTSTTSDNSDCHHACLSVTSNTTVTIPHRLSHNSGRIKKATLSQADSKAAVHYDERQWWNVKTTREIIRSCEHIHRIPWCTHNQPEISAICASLPSSNKLVVNNPNDRWPQADKVSNKITEGDVIIITSMQIVAF